MLLDVTSMLLEVAVRDEHVVDPGEGLLECGEGCAQVLQDYLHLDNILNHGWMSAFFAVLLKVTVVTKYFFCSISDISTRLF